MRPERLEEAADRVDLCKACRIGLNLYLLLQIMNIYQSYWQSQTLADYSLSGVQHVFSYCCFACDRQQIPYKVILDIHT